MLGALLLLTKVILTTALALIAVWGLGTEKVDSYGKENPKRRWVIAALVIVTVMQSSVAGFEWYDKAESDRRALKAEQKQTASLSEILRSNIENLSTLNKNLSLTARALVSTNRSAYPFIGKADLGFLLPPDLLNDNSHIDLKGKLHRLTDDIAKQGRGSKACDELSNTIALCANTGGSKEYIVYRESAYFSQIRDDLIFDLKTITRECRVLGYFLAARDVRS
jgi:hypothetical protein